MRRITCPRSGAGITFLFRQPSHYNIILPHLRVSQDGVTRFKPTSYHKAFRGLLLLLLAILALLSCDLFDIFPPEVEIVSPEEGVSYFDTFPCEVKATDNRKVTRVEVFLNDELVHVFTDEPYSMGFNVSSFDEIPTTLKIVAYDEEDNWTEDGRDISL